LSEPGLTLVLDVGKTRAKLLAIDDGGALRGAWQHASTSVEAPEGYLALDTAGTEAWLFDTLAGMGALRREVRAIVPVTHGAAFAGVHRDRLALPVPDYEWTGFDEHVPGWVDRIDPYAATLAPRLPVGLNAATQFDWLQRHLPGRFEAVERWLPYPQYWAWRLCGTAASEVSSLGCHTLLWRPLEGCWSDLARRQGWAARFAPLRRAWETLGLLDRDLASRLGLPEGVQVLCGAHDSNACLARYLRTWPRMTLISTGTWIVVMAPGTPVEPLRARDGDDVLANVSVRGEPVPTARFMGGRDVERLCAGADPSLADMATLHQVDDAGVRVADDGSHVALRGGRRVPAGAELVEALDARERATLASAYAATATVQMARGLGAVGPVTVDGPFAANPVYLQLLAQMLGSLHASTDEVEGTARGGWVLGRWTDSAPTPPQVRGISPLGSRDEIVPTRRTR
jgi:L-fuculokinase